MKRQRKKYQTPTRPWDKERIESEKVIIKNFGLKSKREIWKTQAMLRKYRRLARELAARKDEKKEKVLMERLMKFGLVTKDSALDSILGLTIDDFLNRRLQTVLHKKGFANTPKQARQFITHGNVMIENKKVAFPSYMVPVAEEDAIVVKTLPVKKANTSGVNGGTAE
ncbi:MAG: 30S ribosomal protein S4 [Candidatus Aenigmarchaeota archaeon]|nr:30S ribosomal protein S4 [Candidatus Aenigmarchaeota archaeon]